MVFDDAGHSKHFPLTHMLSEIQDTHSEHVYNSISRLLYVYFGLKSAEVSLVCTYVHLMYMKEQKEKGGAGDGEEKDPTS